MLPETGTAADFKYAMMMCCTTSPLPGERYRCDNVGKIFSVPFTTMGPTGPAILTVTHICGDVHFNVDKGDGHFTPCLVFGYKWRQWYETGILKYIGNDPRIWNRS